MIDASTQRAEEVFYAALAEKTAAERRVFLDGACAGDPALRAMVEEMLDSQSEADRFFLDSLPALKPSAEICQSVAGADELAKNPDGEISADEDLGKRIGPYKLLQKIGEGGCGVVYMAEQEAPVRRRVALKVIKLGMDTKSVIARFEAERQALAMMDHPNIARVLDAGATEAGRPYFVLEPALQATHADGNVSTDLIYVRHEIRVVDTNISLTRIELKDPVYPFFVTLCLKAYANEDVIEQWTEIRNQENGAVTLEHFASSAPLLHAKEYWLTQFRGDYRREATLSEEKLTPGTKILDSKIGTRASRYRIASFILSLNEPAKEDSGEVFGGSLEWPGSYQMAFDVDWNNHLRALCGINPFGEEYHLKPGETFTTPAMLWTWSNEGKGQVSRNFHRWARSYGIRDGNTSRPVLLNNWEATEFNFDEKIIVSLFDGAKELGADLFLLDDGWFGNRHARTNDAAGLGDWQVNTNRLSHGLSYLAAQANQRGIRFGIWLEPEMVDPASDLYELHPEWAIGQPHRAPDLFRNQLGLDLSRPAVRDFVWRSIDDTLKPNPGITYLKWDANRYVTQPGSTYLPAGEQSHLLIDYNFALLSIMSRLAKDFPQVTAMLCSGGGGRVDYGALKYFHTFWPSDNTDPRDRVFIQWGFSHFFPAITMSDHVTKMGNRPLKFALDVAMSGTLGMDLDVSKLSSGERATVAAGIALYKNELRDVTLRGDLYRLESPYDHPRAALDFVSPDSSRAVLFVYQLQDAANKAVKPRGLNPQMRYRVHEVNLPAGEKSKLADDGKTIDGATLMRDGLVPPCQKEFESSVIELAGEK